MKDEITMYSWLAENGLLIKDIAKKIGCDRLIIRNIQNGKPICKEIAMAIRIFTDNQVNPKVRNKGRPRKL